MLALFIKAAAPAVLAPLHEPTRAQKEAGNYPKRKVAWRGMTISIENEVGSFRRGRDWEQRMSAPYGYLCETEGTDGDHVDCFLGPNMDSDTVHVVHARTKDRWDTYDEDKVMLGFNSAAEAKQAFLDNYSDARFFGDMVSMPVDEFIEKARATHATPAMIKAQQLSLFDEVTPVAGSVKADGTVVKPYTRVQKKRAKPPAADGGHPPQRETHREVSSAHTEPADASVPERGKKEESPTAPPESTPAPKIEQATERPAAATTPPPAPPVGKETEKADIPTPKLGQFGAAGESKAARRRINADVVQLLASGKTEYSAEDKALLARYSGNGGCGDSLNEFYTDPAVAAAIWTAVGRLGVTHGTALEPSCGTGVFLHTASEQIRVTGVDIDPVSAKVATILHGDRHDILTSSLERFATSDERQFDVVIGNAPFGIRGGSIKDDKPEVSRADTYFLDTALDKTKPGGVVAMIVNHGTMDSARDEAMRLRFLTKGQFVGAIRMPNTAFEHSHTDVTADIWFFRKRPNDVAGALGTLNKNQLQELGITNETYLKGRYFDSFEGKDHVLGSVEPGWRAKAHMGDDITVTGSMQGVPEEIAAFGDKVPSTGWAEMPDIVSYLEKYDDKTALRRALGGAIKKPYELTKVGSVKTVDGVEYVLEGDPPRWHRMDEVLARTAVTDADDLATAIDQLANGAEVDREALAAQVKAYVDKHGNPGKNEDLLAAARHNRIYYRLIGAVRDNGTLSDLFTPPKAAVVSSFETAVESLALENPDGFSVEEVAARTDKDAETIEDLLHASSGFARLPAGRWLPMDQYLTGELWPKLDEVKKALESTTDPALRQKFDYQAKRLEETIDPKSLEDVDLAVNHAFIPLNIVTAYFNERKAESDNEWIRKQDDMVILYGEGVYTVSGGGGLGYRQGDLVERYLNRSGVKKDEWDDIVKLNTDFKNWLLSSQYRDQVETLYNRKFRGYVAPAFSNAPFDIPGMNTEGLKDFQYGGTRWALAHGKGIIAADVGLGKTVRALMVAKLMKLNGQGKRNMIVVPKSVIANWAKEAERWFPGSRVLTIGETVTGEKSKADTAAERNKKLHEYMQNDYDFVFITQPAFTTLDVDPETKKNYIEDDFWVQRGDKLKNKGDKRVRAIREAYDQSVAQRDFKKRTDAVYFNDLGVDLLMADEAHAYKNLFGVRNRLGQTPKFLGGGGLSDRSLDMQMKTRSVREAHAGKGVFSLTATPTKNSPLEIYSMLMQVAPEVFDGVGIRNSEEFLDRFCEFATGPCLQTDGTINDSLYVSGFKNMDELRALMRKYIDRQTAAEVGLVLPKRDDRMHLVDMTAEQQAVYGELRAQIAESAGNKDATGDAHIFSIMDKMGKAALDLELLGEHAGAVSPKYNEVAKEVGASVKEGGQIVFCEAIQSHDKIKAALVAAGIPANEIAIFNAQTAKTGDARQKIQDQFNAGKLKVVIGNKTMEEGVNLQKGTTDIHHMDIAWEPATMQQRNGRGLRQGNIKEAVRIHSYLSKGSFDGYRYQAVMAKKSWQDMLWNGGNRIENLERPTLSRDEVMVMMSADPEAARAKMEANQALAKERYLAGKTADASGDFVRFQTMKMSYQGLKNKKSDAAERLRIRIGAAKERLSGNKYFKAKAALESESPVLLHPDTGTVLMQGVGLERDGQKWVIAAVDTADQSVTMRPYGVVGAAARSVTLDVKDMGDTVKPFDYKESDETAALSDQFAANEEDFDMKSLRNLPPAVITENYRTIQRRLKSGLANYKSPFSYGVLVPYLEAGTVPRVAQSFETQKLGEQENAELLLPTPEHRKIAIDEYIKAQHARDIRMEYPPSQRMGRSRPPHLVAKYITGHHGGMERNPWESAGAAVFGDSFKTEARAAFDQQQNEVMKNAPTFAEAVRAAAPTLQVDYSSVKWPKDTLAILFAKAKRDGLLDHPLADAVPKKAQYSNMVDELHRDVWKTSRTMGGHVSLDVRELPVGDAMVKLAIGAGYHALAAAMIVSADPPNVAASKLMELPLTNPDVIASIAHLAEKHPALAARKAEEFIPSHTLRTAVGYGHADATFGELADLLATRTGVSEAA